MSTVVNLDFNQLVSGIVMKLELCFCVVSFIEQHNIKHNFIQHHTN